MIGPEIALAVMAVSVIFVVSLSVLARPLPKRVSVRTRDDL